MDGDTPANAGRAAIWLLRELTAQLQDQGVLDGTALHKRLLTWADNPANSAEVRAEGLLAASVVEEISSHPKRP